MKKYLLALMAVMGFSTLSHATVKPPHDNLGAVAPLDFAGASTCRLNQSTGTTGVACTTAPALVYGVSVSSDAVTNFVALRDNATGATTGQPSLVIWNQGNGVAQAVPGTLFQKLPVPMKFSTGLSAVMNAAIPTGTQSEWVIFYRLLSAPEN